MKKNLLILGLGILTSTSLFAQIPTSGLVGHFPFNGNANDASSSGNNGTVSGASLTSDRFGNPNSAYSFNGSSNYIKVDNTKNLSNDTYTYSVWINPTVLPTSGKFAYFLDIGTESFGSISYGQTLGFNNSYFGYTGWAASTSKSSNPNTTNRTDLSILPLVDKWYHVVLTRDNTKLRLFVNNLLVTESSTGASTAYSSPNSLYLGNRSLLDAGAYFNGKLDDIRLYNRVLTSQEIDNLYNENTCTQKVSVTDTLEFKLNISGVYGLVNTTVKVFPNPTNSFLNVDFGNLKSTAGFTFNILNSVGNNIYTSKIDTDNLSIDIKNIGSAGIYFINIVDTNGNIVDTKKLILK